MTTTENPPSKHDEIEARAQRLSDAWVRKDEADRMARARSVARRQVEAERRAVHDAIPANWEHRMRKAGATGLAQTWKGAPVDPSTCIIPGPWDIDEDGVWFTPESQPKQFVCSPIVATRRGGPFAALVNGKWKTVEMPGGMRGLPVRTIASEVTRALDYAGVKFGKDIVTGFRADNLDHRPASVYAAIWLLGIDPVSDSIGQFPVRRLTDLRPAAEDVRPDSGEGRQQLGEVIGRHSKDVWR